MLGFFLTLFILFKCIDYIFKSIFFIKPMTEKYKILSDDLNNNIKDRYLIIFVCIVVVSLLIIATYINNVFLYIINISIIFIYGLIKYLKYSKYTFLDYINEYSCDLFDWYKIFELNIDEITKVKCFEIHNIDYDDFRINYLNYLKNQKEHINNKINNLKNEK